VSPLAFIGQDDFAAGVLSGVARDVTPGVGVAACVNGLFDDDGDVYRRGGTNYASAVADGPLTFLWTGYLGTQVCGLAATATSLYSFDPTVAPPAVMALTKITGAAGLPGPVLPAVVADKLYLPNGNVWDGTALTTLALPGAGTRHVAAIAGRLAVGYGNHVAFSAIGDPATIDPTDFHQLPDGVVVVGMTALRDLLLVFTAYGLWTVQNMALDLTDAAGNPQQTLSRLTPELSLLHEAGLCDWAGTIVAPCADRVFLVDGLSPPVSISDSIAPDYMALIRAGARPGGAKVFRNHLFLPMLIGAAVQEVLVCRLNRPVRGRYVYYPFSTLDGHAGQIVAGGVSLLSNVPRLLCAHRDGHIVGMSNLFNPSASWAKDADGSVPVFDLETRDFPTGNGQPNHTRKLRLVYTLEGQGNVQAAASYGQSAQDYETAAVGTYAQLKSTYASYVDLLHNNTGASDPWYSPADPTRVCGTNSTRWRRRPRALTRRCGTSRTRSACATSARASSAPIPSRD
jgi:hypothetical protein